MENRRIHVDKETRQRILDMWHSGMTLDEIRAEFVGCDDDTIRYISHLKTKGHPQLCWECRRAYADSYACSWVKSFTPVEGWDAKPTTLHNSKSGHYAKPISSFWIRECPQFLKEEE